MDALAPARQAGSEKRARSRRSAHRTQVEALSHATKDTNGGCCGPRLVQSAPNGARITTRANPAIAPTHAEVARALADRPFSDSAVDAPTGESKPSGGGPPGSFTSGCARSGARSPS